MGLTVHFEVLNQLGTPMLYSDTLALRPAAGITGRIFYRTDSPFGIYRDNGTTWDLISSVGSATGVTGTGVATRVAYWDTTSSISSDAGLYFDPTNDRLGIGTITPGAALDAHQTSGTIIQANATALGNSQFAFQLQGTSKWQIGNVYQSGANYFRINDALSSVERVKVQNTGEFDIQGWEVLINTQTGLSGTSTIPFNNSFTNNFTYNSGLNTIASFNSIGFIVDNNYNFSGANTINSTSYNAALVLRSNMTFGTAAASITYTQATGIRALSNKQSIYIQSGANSGTISHYANLQIFGDQKTGAGTTTFTNRYQILLNDYAEFAAGNTYTNRWAIYQDGASNTNYFNGKIITGSSTTVSTYQLDVTGTTRLSSDALINSLTIGLGNSSIATNTALGYQTLNAVTTSTQSTAVGYQSLKSSTTGSYNTSIGWQNSVLLNTGNYNTSIGADAQVFLTNNSENTAVGFRALKNNTSSSNTSIGSLSGTEITTGGQNSIFGASALGKNTTGSYNVAIGQSAGLVYTGAVNLTIANNSIFIGANTIANGNNETNQIVIGQGATGLGSNSTMLGSSSTTLTAIRGSLLLGTTTTVASSLLTMVSTTQGLLPPVMTKTQRNAISSPASGLLVINSTDATLDGYDGTAAAWYQSVRSDNGYVKVNATTSATSSGASGQHLQINVNGTNYKIALLNV